MMRMDALLTAGAALAMLGSTVQAQSLAQRVRAVGTGVAELRYAARPGTCGDGRDSFSFGSGMHFGTWFGRASDGMMPPCQPGPARLRVRVEAGTITSLHVSVGPARQSEERPTDLGTVPSQEAAAFFLALADSTDGNVAQRAIMAAVLADSTSVWPQLLAIASDTVRASRSARHGATFWAGRFAAAKLAGDADDLAAADDGDDRDDARSAAVFALSQLRGHAGVEPLLQVARTNRDPSVRRKALFWLGESGDPRAIALFREILRG
jgi:HEAT repeat protein